MPFSPIRALQLIQEELHNMRTPQGQENRLHEEVRGEELEFTLVRNGESEEVALRFDNVAVGENFDALVRCSLRDYECPVGVEDWKEDIRHLYANHYLRDPKELGSPLLSGVEITGHNPYDIQIGYFVHHTTQSALWESANRFRKVITLYHSDLFQITKEQFHEFSDSEWDEEDVPMGAAIPIAEEHDEWNVMQAWGYLRSYASTKLDEEDKSSKQTIEIE